MEENVDQRHLELLSVFHYIVGAVLALFACIPLIHLSLGIALLSGAIAESNTANPAPEWLGLIFAVVGGIAFLIGQALAVLVIYSGIQIRNRQKYMLSFVIACIMCAFAPFGTVLGIFTIIVLSRDSVKRLYGKNF